MSSGAGTSPPWHWRPSASPRTAARRSSGWMCSTSTRPSRRRTSGWRRRQVHTGTWSPAAPPTSRTASWSRRTAPSSGTALPSPPSRRPTPPWRRRRSWGTSTPCWTPTACCATTCSPCACRTGGRSPLWPWRQRTNFAPSTAWSRWRGRPWTAMGSGTCPSAAGRETFMSPSPWRTSSAARSRRTTSPGRSSSSAPMPRACGTATSPPRTAPSPCTAWSTRPTPSRPCCGGTTSGRRGTASSWRCSSFC